MEGKKILAIVALVVIFTVFISAAYTTKTSAGGYQVGVFSVSYGWGTWIYLNDYEFPNYTSILSLSLPPIPIDAYYHVICDGYVAVDDCMVIIAIGVDAPIEDDRMSTRRLYGNHGNAEGLDGYGIHSDRVYQLDPGEHTFYFLGAIYAINDPDYYADVNYMTITVVVYTDGSVTQFSTMTEGELPIEGYAG